MESHQGPKGNPHCRGRWRKGRGRWRKAHLERGHRLLWRAEPLDAEQLLSLVDKEEATLPSQTPARLERCVSRPPWALERTCERENTIVVFSSDNGGINDCPLHGTDTYPGWQEEYPRLGSNLPYRGVKAQLYEGGIRTPTLVNWRSHLAPGQVDAPVQVVDWMPTFTQLVGATPTADPMWDGQDIWPLIDGRDTSPDERTLFWNFRGDRNLGVRHGDWKLQVTARPDKRWLFNLAEDPTEQNNLADSHPEKLAELTALLDEHQRQSRGPLYPAVSELPVALDKNLSERFEQGDEYIYWPN